MIDPATRRLVRARAGDRCEYCRTRQADEPFVTYQIEHIVASQHHGSDHADNLALACPHCNQHKGPNLAGVDPATGRVEILFHPRTQNWEEHFSPSGPFLVGKTPCGRATVDVLDMNEPLRVELRRYATEWPGE